MSTVMTETPLAPERRGGANPDWDRAKPGEDLPEKDDPEFWDPEDPRFGAGGCQLPECEDDRDLRHDRGVRSDGELHRRVGIGWHWCGTPGCGGD